MAFANPHLSACLIPLVIHKHRAIVKTMRDVNETTTNSSGSTLVRNANNTIVLTLVGHISTADIQHLLKHLLLQIVALRDDGKRVLVFIDTSKVTNADPDISETALQLLQSDCDHIAIYSTAHGHRSGIQRLVKKLDRHEHIGVFGSEDEATAWVAEQEKHL